MGWARVLRVKRDTSAIVPRADLAEFLANAFRHRLDLAGCGVNDLPDALIIGQDKFIEDFACCFPLARVWIQSVRGVTLSVNGDFCVAFFETQGDGCHP